jgi:hypothetical protein
VTLRAGQIDRELNLPAVARTFGKILNRLPSAQVIQRGGTKIRDQRTKIADLDLELTDRVPDRIDRRLELGSFELGGQREPERGESLKGFVVPRAAVGHRQ